MPVTLTAPAVKYTATFQGVKEIVFEIPHHVVNGRLVVNTNSESQQLGFRLRCDYASWDENGVKVDKKTVYFSWNDLPQAGKDMIRSLYNWLETKGETDGVIGAGVKNDIEAAP